MSALSHFQSVANAAILSTAEVASINTSITTLSSRLTSHFGLGIKEKLRFGSSTRGTILPRNLDEQSDIDYMVVFSDAGFKPQTYLARLTKFAETYYSSSEAKQSHPTIILELNHIKFDLVPALSPWTSNYQIPDKQYEWQNTDPLGFSTALEQANIASGSLLKPAIRVVKRWNASRGYPLESFSLERWMAGLARPYGANLSTYVLNAIGLLSPWSYQQQWIRNEIERAQTIAARIRQYEANGQTWLAADEAKKLAPI